MPHPSLLIEAVISDIVTPRIRTGAGSSMRFAAFAFGLLAASPAAAAPLLHPMFADHAVLQRDQPIRIYGQAPAGSDIRVQLGMASATANAGANGQWSATLPAMPAGGPYDLQVSSGAQNQQGRGVHKPALCRERRPARVKSVVRNEVFIRFSLPAPAAPLRFCLLLTQ